MKHSLLKSTFQLLVIILFCFLTSWTITKEPLQTKPSFLGCEFGTSKSFTISYFEKNLSGEISNNNPDTVTMNISGFVGDFKASYLTLVFHGNVFVAGTISFSVQDNIESQNKSNLLALIKKQILKKYPSLKQLKEDGLLSNFDLGKTERYVSGKWAVEFSESYFFESVDIEMYETDLLKKYMISKKGKIDFK